MSKKESKLPSGFKTREEYNAYMRQYRARQVQQRADYQGIKEQFAKQPDLVAEKVTSGIPDNFRDRIMSMTFISDEMVENATRLAYGTYVLLFTNLADALKMPYAERVQRLQRILLSIIHNSVLNPILQFRATYDTLKEDIKHINEYPEIPEEMRRSLVEYMEMLDVFYEKIQHDVKFAADIAEAEKRQNKFVV